MLVNGILTHFPDKKLVSASGMAGFDSSNTIVTRQVMPNFYLCGDGISEPAYGHGLMAARVAICAAHEANMITRLLLGGSIRNDYLSDDMLHRNSVYYSTQYYQFDFSRAG